VINYLEISEYNFRANIILSVSENNCIHDAIK